MYSETCQTSTMEHFAIIANVVIYFCKMLHRRCLTVLNMPLGGDTHELIYKSGNAVFISEIWKMSVSMSTKLAFDSFSPT